MGHGSRRGVASGEDSDMSDHNALVQQLLRSVLVDQADRLSWGDELGRGGVGAVRIAHDRSLKRRMAVKQLLESSLQEPMAVRGFLREAQVTAQLEHPSIVPVHDIGVRNGLPFFTMSLVEGRSLSTWLREEMLIDYDTVVRFLEIVLKVCDALEFAHHRGVIHGDIKPANVMVGAFGQVYLMDWGGAELVEDMAPDDGQTEKVQDNVAELPREVTEGRAFGTISYMAPERARGQRGDARSDIFSLGAVIYEFLVGKPPFRTGEMQSSLRKAAFCDYAPIDETSHGSEVPPDLYRIVRRALSAAPADRYQSMGELKADIGRLVRGGGSFPLQSYPKGTLLIREGDRGDAAFIVATGRLEVYRQVQGQQVTLRTLQPGDVFGEMALLAGAPRTASVRVLEDARVVTITEAVFFRELDSMQPWMAALVKTLAHRFLDREASQLGL